MNQLRAAKQPVSFWTSCTHTGRFIQSMAPTFSGLASIPRSETRKPSNFPPGTPNVHFDGLSLISYLLRLAKVSARSISRSEPFHITTDLSEQTLLNHPHERGSDILEAERHGNITEAPEWSDKSCFDLVGSI